MKPAQVFCNPVGHSHRGGTLLHTRGTGERVVPNIGLALEVTSPKQFSMLM